MTKYVLKRYQRDSWLQNGSTLDNMVFMGNQKDMMVFNNVDDITPFMKRTKKRVRIQKVTNVRVREVTNGQYHRKEIYSVDEVLPFIGEYDKEYDGDMISMGSARYLNFATHGLTCVHCGLTGSFFAKETTDFYSDIPKYHFNLYAINENGEEVLMTKDHILPRSLGGADDNDNYQPMCVRCNQKKGNKIEVKK